MPSLHRRPTHRRAATRPWLEALEDRVLPSLSPQLLKDINLTNQWGSLLSSPVNVSGGAFFKANDGVHGFELWRL